ncbi:MAG: zinc ribbon domain-containing protein [Candidatus Neomarinimicrobiota bacterium]
MDLILPPLILLIVFTGAAYYVLVPFLSEPVIASGDEFATRTVSLELRKVNLFEQIREVEFEREMGLINDEDFDRTRTDLMAEAAQVIGDLEGSSSGPTTTVTSTVGPPAAAPVCPACELPLDPGARFCSSCGTEVGRECPSCREIASPGDLFCAHCGRGLRN